MKPTYEDLLHALAQLAEIADRCIPSDHASNAALMDAEVAIGNALELVTRALNDTPAKMGV